MATAGVKGLRKVAAREKLRLNRRLQNVDRDNRRRHDLLTPKTVPYTFTQSHTRATWKDRSTTVNHDIQPVLT